MMTPDHSPDLVVSASTADVNPVAVPVFTPAATTNAPCAYCGKDPADYLTLSEAFSVNLSYARTNCLYCQLTDLRRRKPSMGLVTS